MDNSLYDFIMCLKYGTKLHIGVLFFGDYGNERLYMPRKNTLHSGAVCSYFKKDAAQLKRCRRCRNGAVNKALNTKQAFGGLCVNGIYEYTRPVVEGEDVVCIIYIGNILPEDERESRRILRRLRDEPSLADSLERNFSPEKCEMLGQLIENYIRMVLTLYPKHDAKFEPLIENLKSYIEANLEYDIALCDLARIFHYNEKYLGRLFLQKTGMKVSEYINYRRLKVAVRYLDETEDSVISIASKVGFNNVTYFNRVFKRRFRVTPTEYRKSKGSKAHGI